MRVCWLKAPRQVRRAPAASRISPPRPALTRALRRPLEQQRTCHVGNHSRAPAGLLPAVSVWVRPRLDAAPLHPQRQGVEAAQHVLLHLRGALVTRQHQHRAACKHATTA
jgi:hypothetical protein